MKRGGRVAGEIAVDEESAVYGGHAFKLSEVAGLEAGAGLDEQGIDGGEGGGVAVDEDLAVGVGEGVGVAHVGHVGVAGVQDEPLRGHDEEGGEEKQDGKEDYWEEVKTKTPPICRRKKMQVFRAQTVLL